MSYEKRYEINAYYGSNFLGIADSAETDDFSEMESIVWDFVQRYCVEVTDWETGASVRYRNPDEVDLIADLDPFEESYRKRFSGRKRNMIKENYDKETMETIGSLIGDMFYALDRQTKGKNRKQISDYSDDGYLEIDEKLYQERKDFFDRYKRMFKKVLGTDKYIIDKNIGGLHIFGVDYNKMNLNESNGRKRRLRESEDKEVLQYNVPFGLELWYDYDRDFELDEWEDELFDDMYDVISEHVENAANSNPELQKLDVKLDKDNVETDMICFLITTTPDNLDNAVELLRKTFKGNYEHLFYYDQTVQTNYRPGEYYGYGIWGDERWDEGSIRIGVDFEIKDICGEITVWEE